MRLYLSSERLGDRSGALLAMLHGPRVAVIANGYDVGPAASQRIYGAELYDLMAEFRALGLDPREVDLRAHFGDAASLRERLATYHLAWVMGGNSFVLRRAMKQSGFDAVIRDLLNADGIAYGGYAAGAAVAGPTLRGLELMDDPFEVPDGYDEPLVWSGLGLTPFAVVPHYRSRHREAATAEKVVSYMRARRTRYRAISDGEVIVQMGKLERLAS
ncbi:MAG TPA: Type 1 glutamine amidotransferase-like domain-containing protein [Devosia sp.]|jgi:dipeptidase E|nr:Type 1 glutamine amidotransferase-like domain-containing protein [Devosia sp.]